ncbi:reverse transcriptase domain-containing protein [Tanacetum coccineum]
MRNTGGECPIRSEELRFDEEASAKGNTVPYGLAIFREGGEDSEGGHWKSKSDDIDRAPMKDDLSSLGMILKLFLSAAKTEGWAMPTWCHMFNSTLTRNARVWFDKLLKESIDSYEDLRTAFRENYLQQTKHIKDPVEIHHIKQRDGESTEDFMERYKAEVLDTEGAPECMRISGFMHGITHHGLIKRLYERILRFMDEMYRMTTSFLQGEVAAFSHGRRKASSSWKELEGGTNRISRKASKTNKNRIKVQSPTTMVTPAEENGSDINYCEFHSDTGHSIDECMQLRKQID